MRLLASGKAISSSNDQYIEKRGLTMELEIVMMVRKSHKSCFDQDLSMIILLSGIQIRITNKLFFNIVIKYIIYN